MLIIRRWIVDLGGDNCYSLRGLLLRRRSIGRSNYAARILPSSHVAFPGESG